MNLVGQTFGQYRIIEPIGAGGMATVYKAYQAGLDRYVAVKVLPAQHALTPGFKERFSREARAVARLSHPNILPIYDFGIKDDISYFVMKYVPDHTLSHLLGRPMGLERASHFIDQVASALDHAHERGIVHRDIKPSNMLLEGDWLLLADFGLAKIVKGSQVLTATGATLGTPAYVSPEQAEGRPVDHRSDIYSLGIVLYEMVTGQVPYTGETPVGVIFKHIYEPLPPPRSVNPDLDDSVARVILKATTKNPDERYDQAEGMAEALRQAVQDARAAIELFPGSPTPLAPAGPAGAAEPVAQSLPTMPPLRAEPGAPTIPPSEPLPSAQPLRRRLASYSGLLLAGIGLSLLLLSAAIAFFASGNGTTDQPSARAQDDGVLPTFTLLPAATPTRPEIEPTDPPPARSDLSPLTADNVHRLEQLARLGRGTITALAVGPDGALIAVGGSLGVWLYDGDTWEPLGLLEGHTEPVTAVAWSPNGDSLASAGKDGLVRVWVLPQGGADAVSAVAEVEERRVLRGHVGTVASLAWSVDGQLASGGWDDTVRLWDVATGTEQRVLTSHTEAVVALAWSPDGAQLASGSRDGTVRLWQVAQGREIGTFDGHGGAVTGLAWSPDGTSVASASEDETVRIWSAADQAEQQLLSGHTSYVQSVAWSPDGTKLASSALDRTLRVWDAATGQEYGALRGHTEPVRALSWLPDGVRLASAADDGSMRVWDTTNRAELQVLAGFADAVLSVAWSPDGTRLVAGVNDGTVQTWDALTGASLHVLRGHKGEVNAVAWSPDGTQIASAGGTLDDRVLVWDSGVAGAPRALEGHSGTVMDVSWSPDGAKLASASWDDSVRIWDAAGLSLHVLADHNDWALSVAWSPDGAQVASGSKDGAVRIWDAVTGELARTLTGHGEQVTSVAWSPDGAWLASTGRDETIRLWDLGGQDRTQVLQTVGSVTSVVWSPDSTWLATVSEFRDHVVRIWDAETGREVGALEGHVDDVNGVAWSPDGTRLATASEDGTVRVWGVPVGR